MKPTTLTIPRFEPERYIGRWYEIARLPFKWEQGCTHATADYSWDNKTQKMTIVNTCLKEIRPGVLSVVYGRTGHAHIIDPRQPGKLEVKFDDGRPADPPGAYWIHWTDYDDFSFVGGKGASGELHLWVLSRKPQITLAESKWILSSATTLGYPSRLLIADPNVIV